MSVKKSNTLEVTEEMKILMEDYVVYDDCKVTAIKSLFKTKKAVYYGRKALKAREKFWELAYDLYPEVKENDNWNYSFTDKCLIQK